MKHFLNKVNEDSANRIKAGKYVPAAYFSAYLEHGYIHESDDHEVVGITPEQLKKVISQLSDPDFLYARTRSYGTSFYKRDPKSPTGVIEFGGVSNEYSFLVEILTITSSLSPTEDLRTAH